MSQTYTRPLKVPPKAWPPSGWKVTEDTLSEVVEVGANVWLRLAYLDWASALQVPELNFARGVAASD